MVPACKSGGCPIEDVASDISINEFVSAYVAARRLYDANKIPEILMGELRKLGLMEDFNFLLKLEVIFSNSKRIEKQPEVIESWKSQR